MSTGKDYGLPEYADWVEVFVPPTEPGCEYVETGSRHHRVASVAFLNTTQVGRQRYFVPPKPKPKPTLPDVKLGGVVRYRDADDQLCLAVRIGADQWVNFTRQDETPAKLFAATPWTDDELLDDADDDGFTVELDGLA